MDYYGDKIMEFDQSDESDLRIVDCSPEALDFPKDAGQAPEKEGVYLIINGDDEVAYVGIASGTSLKSEINARSYFSDGKGTQSYRWFVTQNHKGAEELGANLIRKYCL